MPSMTDILIPALAVIFVTVFMAVAFLTLAVIIVPEHKRVVIHRFGRSKGTLGPGIVAMIPFLDTVTWIDLQKARRYTFKGLLTADNRQISLEVALEVKARGIAKGMALTPDQESAFSAALATEVTDITRARRRDELLGQDEWMRAQLRARAIAVAGPLGIEVTELIIVALG